MTGGGLRSLVAYGAQNVILSGRPQFSYFYKVFRKYTHFAMENIGIPLEGPNELKWDQPIDLRAKIPRFGDLLSDLYLSVDIPAIYSKFVPTSGTGSRGGHQLEFQWSRYLGLAMIQTAGFYVGGQKIQEVTGQYLLAKALLDMDQDTFLKWQQLVGDVADLYDPAKGQYPGGTTQTAYPTVVTNPALPAGAAQANRPSIQARTLHIPLSFWFTEDTSLSVPLVGLQTQECEFRVTLAPLQNLYTVLDTGGYRVGPTYRMTATAAEYAQGNPTYASIVDPVTEFRQFVTDINASPPLLNTQFVNPRLQGTFIYLPQEEQEIFATRPLTYIVSQMTPQPYLYMTQRQTLDLYIHNPITRLVFFQQRSDANRRNDFANFTNWINPARAPWQAATGLDASQNAVTSGVVVPNTQPQIIRSIRVLANGNEIQEPKPVEFFSLLSAYTMTPGIGDPGLPLYSFQLHPSATQPSGSINTSKINNFQVDLDLYPLPTLTNYTYNIIIFVENLNWFEVVSGMGALKYAL